LESFKNPLGHGYWNEKKMDLPHDCKKTAKAVKLSLKCVDRSATGKGLQPLDRIRKEDGRIIPKGPCHTHTYIYISNMGVEVQKMNFNYHESQK
jgi:hypothetical protein